MVQLYIGKSVATHQGEGGEFVFFGEALGQVVTIISKVPLVLEEEFMNLPKCCVVDVDFGGVSEHGQQMEGGTCQLLEVGNRGMGNQ